MQSKLSKWKRRGRLARPRPPLTTSHSMSSLADLEPKTLPTSSSGSLQECHRRRKRVCFAGVVKAILVPSLKSLNLSEQQLLWYTSSELALLKRNALRVWRVYGSLGVIEDELNAYDLELAKQEQEALGVEPAPQASQQIPSPTRSAPLYKTKTVDQGCSMSSPTKTNGWSCMEMNPEFEANPTVQEVQ